MSMEYQLRVAAAHCLSLIQRYHDGARTASAKERMVAEVEMIIGWLLELNLPAGAMEKWVLRPVETHLFAQYGQEVGRRLNAELVEVFEGAGMQLNFSD
jgi:hypothetical protein